MTLADATVVVLAAVLGVLWFEVYKVVGKGLRNRW